MFTTADIEAGYTNDDYLGFGYLNGRRIALESTDPEAPAQPEKVAEADAAALADANQAGLTATEFFEWLNSRPGRYYADCMFGGGERFAPEYLPSKFAR